ncbi:MAG: hypothetical protein B1H08_05835 [Candidatus Omnitrophica bacterium 4484_171]|nr:MAG: hypothetical protein B1H08_05835 [Candidatus Omnitrophica bacterium 4484_171]
MFLGIDWGGTYIKAGITDNRGNLLSRRVFFSSRFKNKDAFIKKIEELTNSVRPRRINAVGIGVPGIIDTKGGFIYYLPNIPGWQKYPIRKVLEKKLNIPVAVDNDANVFALAEARIGAAKGTNRAIFLTLGTGLGGAVIIDGNIFKGRTSAGELGHVPVSLKGARCGCGGTGCIETFLGNKYLVSLYKRIKRQKNLNAEVKDIFKNALEGEEEAILVWENFSYALGMFLSGMINVFNPEKIIFGGGVSGAFKVFKPLVWKVIENQAMWPHIKTLKLIKAKLKNAGIIGAAILAKEQLANG